MNKQIALKRRKRRQRTIKVMRSSWKVEYVFVEGYLGMVEGVDLGICVTCEEEEEDVDWT